MKTTKRNRRRLPIAQDEFGFTPDTFNLFAEATLDGERITCEQTEAERAHCLAEQAQAPLPMPDDG
jgi:hypothetical protein